MSKVRPAKKADNGIDGPESVMLMRMIASKDFYSNISEAINSIKLDNQIVSKVVSWIVDYYKNQTEKDPNNHDPVGENIGAIFELNKGELEKEEQDVTRAYLKGIFPKLKDNFSLKLETYKALEHLERLHQKDICKNLELMLKAGKSNDEINKYLLSATKKQYQSIRTDENLHDADKYIEALRRMKEPMFKFEGELGNYLFPMQRGKFVAFLGKTKGKKSFWLLETSKNLVKSGSKVAYYSLEMGKDEMRNRWGNMVTGLYEGETIIQPVFDCLKNQNRSCTDPDCPDNESIYDSNTGVLTPFEDAPDHIICPHIDNCSDYQFSSWFEEQTTQLKNNKNIKKWMKMFENHFGRDRIRFDVFEIDTHPIEKLFLSIEKMIASGFDPDAIVIDYADLFKGKQGMDKRFQLNNIWSALSRLAKILDKLVVTATQTNRAAMYKPRLTAEDTAEDFSKVQIVDWLIGINERPGEKGKKGDKYWHRQFLEVLARREGNTPENLVCWVLNNLGKGMIHIDSKVGFI